MLLSKKLLTSFMIPSPSKMMCSTIRKHLKTNLHREEIRGLINGTHPALAPGHKPVPAEDLIYYGLEYKFVTLYITGELTFEQMRTQLATAIHQFAKRQMTWFRGMERKGIRIHWTTV